MCRFVWMMPDRLFLLFNWTIDQVYSFLLLRPPACLSAREAVRLSGATRRAIRLHRVEHTHTKPREKCEFSFSRADSLVRWVWQSCMPEVFNLEKSFWRLSTFSFEHPVGSLNFQQVALVSLIETPLARLHFQSTISSRLFCICFQLVSSRRSFF